MTDSISLSLIFSLLLTSVVIGQTKVAEKNSENPTQSETKMESSIYVEDLTKMAEEGKLQFTEGLEGEVEKVEKFLASTEQTKRGTILVDKYGSKRTATVENLALRLTTENIAENLRGKRVLKINLVRLISDAKDEQEVNARLDGVLKTIETFKSRAIVFVEDMLQADLPHLRLTK